MKTSFEGHSKAMITPHPAYAASDMPARKLEYYVSMGVKSGVGMMEPAKVAEALYGVASSGKCIPLRLPLGPTAWKMAKGKFEGALAALETVKDISAMGQEL